jgi:hypothetical protein
MGSVGEKLDQSKQHLVFVLVFKKTNTTGVVLIDRDFSPTDPM